MELSSALTFEMLGKPFLLEKRIVLLHAIKEHGSISKAAKAVPMSYKSAWEAVDVMNSLSPEAIVTRETGGKDGGGTTVTSYGETLLTNYALLKAEHTRFLERLSTLTDIQSGTFKTIGRLAMQLSARNQIQAKVVQIQSKTVHSEVTMKLKSGQIVCAVVTQEAVENLQIAIGESITAIFKSSSVSLTGEKDSDTNHVSGSILELEKDENHCKMTVDIGCGDRIVAVLNEDEIAIPLKIGVTIEVAIAQHQIMLGK